MCVSLENIVDNNNNYKNKKGNNKNCKLVNRIWIMLIDLFGGGNAGFIRDRQKVGKGESINPQ